MQRITFQDIRKRLIVVDESVEGYSSMHKYVRSASDYTSITKRPEDTLRKIKYGCEANFVPPMDYLLEMYNSLYENPESTIGQIDMASRYIAEDALPKIKSDAKSIQENIKNKMIYAKSRAKRFLSKKTNDIKRATNTEDDNKKKDPNKKEVDKKENKNKNTLSNNQQDSKTEAFIDGCERMLHEIEINTTCYRIINNYNKLSKRFNIDRLLRENTLRNGVYDSVLELSKLVDTYQINSAAKFNAVIESAYYGLSAANYPFDKKEILEGAVDYFSSYYGGLEVCRSVLEDSLIYGNGEIPPEIETIHEEEPEETVSTPDSISMEIEEHAIRRFNKNIELPQLVFTESSEVDFNKVFSDWKKNHEDDKPSAIKQLIRTLYSRSPNQIVNGTPKLLKYIRAMIIITTLSISPYLSAVSFFADGFIKNHVEKNEIEKMIKCFKNEIKETENKIDSCNDDEEQERLEKYLDACENALDKLKDHYSEIVKDDDNEEEYDDDWDDDAWDESALAVNTLSNLVSKYMNLRETAKFPNVDHEFMKSIGPSNIYMIAEFVSQYPNCYDKEAVLSLYEDYNASIKPYSYTERAALRDSIELINTGKPVLNESNNIYDNIKYFTAQCNGMEAINEFITAQQFNTSLTEASFITNLKTASYNLKKSMKEMNDKARTIARKFDTAVNVLAKKSKDAMTNDNREAIIKGSIIPSASKLVKMGIASAGLCALGQPVIAVIGVLSYIGINKATAARQRQDIIDDIEVELKMCDKYIEEAEAKDDKAALRELYKIQRSLERTNQRVKHRMKVLGQPVHDIPRAGSNY